MNSTSNEHAPGLGRAPHVSEEVFDFDLVLRAVLRTAHESREFRVLQMEQNLAKEKWQDTSSLRNER